LTDPDHCEAKYNAVARERLYGGGPGNASNPAEIRIAFLQSKRCVKRHRRSASVTACAQGVGCRSPALPAQIAPGMGDAGGDFRQIREEMPSTDKRAQKKALDPVKPYLRR
jgi:hypothetical protein